MALVIVMGFATGVMAQQTDNDVITARAEVSAQVNVTQVSDLIFGMATPGVTKTISTEGVVLAGLAGTAPNITPNGGVEQAGKFSVAKGLNTSVNLAFTLPSSLSDAASHNLPINFNDAGVNKLAKLSTFGGTQSDLSFTPGTGITTANTGTTAAYFTDDAFYVMIGGTVVPASDQFSGVYTGPITLTATYN